ncbi:SPOR domain-containing protein [Rhodohalobacter sp. 8-1]|uniref:SPOR domain-containing protein n=1 Tax=Rhodohalobacter sp. 8-1 TaxID=3131972 RepID=UPI0030EED6A0
MKSALIYITTIFFTIALFQACSPEEPEVEQTTEAVQDSLEQVYEAEMEQMRQDSIAQAREDSLAAAQEQEQQQNRIEYSEDGEYVVQIEAWRSQQKAQQQANQWINRGYDQAYVVSYGNEDTGNVWYRVRVGEFDSREMAQRLKSELEEEYGTASWISRIGQPVEKDAMQSN